MASHESAKKRIRQNAKRRARNKTVRLTVRSIVKNVRKAIETGDMKLAKEQLPKAIQLLDRAVSKGVMHHRAAARTISRLTQRVAALKK